MMAMQQQQNQMNQQTPQNQQKTLTNGGLVCTMKVLLCLCRVSSLKIYSIHHGPLRFNDDLGATKVKMVWQKVALLSSTGIDHLQSFDVRASLERHTARPVECHHKLEKGHFFHQMHYRTRDELHASGGGKDSKEAGGGIETDSCASQVKVENWTRLLEKPQSTTNQLLAGTQRGRRS